MIYDHEPFQYSPQEIERLYARHVRHNLCTPEKTLALFKDELINEIDDLNTLIFRILPKSPEINEKFYEHLTNAEFDLVSGLANLAGFRPHNIPIILNPDIGPDICMTVHKDTPITTFDPASCHINVLAEDILTYYWDNFTVEQMQSLSEYEQGAFLRLMDKLNVDLTADQTAHKKLVFALHIPQEIKQYHRACIEELSLRILTSPVYAGFFESFLDKNYADRSHLPFTDNEKDRRFFVSFLVKEMAEIWGIPTPIEEDYNEPSTVDFEGKKFTTTAHAFFRATHAKNTPAGLIFGINTHNGYLENQGYKDIKTLAHEFGHLISNFITFGRQLPDLDKSSAHVQRSPLSLMMDSRNVFLINSPINVYGQYYSYDKTDFSGLPKPEGMHYYKGQLEERHADWLGHTISKALETALDVRLTIKNFSATKQEILHGADEIMEDLKLPHKNPLLYKTLSANLEQMHHLDDIQPVLGSFLRTLAKWYKNNVNDTKEMMFMNSNALDIRRPVLTPNMLAKSKIQSMNKGLVQFSRLYELYCDHHGKNSHHSSIIPPLPLEENALSHSA